MECKTASKSLQMWPDIEWDRKMVIKCNYRALLKCELINKTVSPHPHERMHLFRRGEFTVFILTFQGPDPVWSQLQTCNRQYPSSFFYILAGFIQTTHALIIYQQRPLPDWDQCRCWCRCLSVNVRGKEKKTRRKCFKHAKSQGQELNTHYDLAPPPLSLCASVCMCVCLHGTKNTIAQ